jgi:hypothetical protein
MQATDKKTRGGNTKDQFGDYSSSLSPLLEGGVGTLRGDCKILFIFICFILRLVHFKCQRCQMGR